MTDSSVRLRMIVRSYADMTMGRAMAVGRAFDEHPNLRPTKVGGDPAQILVGQSLAGTIQREGLPASWSTEQRISRGVSTYGQIELWPGRGRFFGYYPPRPGEFLLSGHEVDQGWPRTYVDCAAAIDDLKELLVEVVVASDATYARIGSPPGYPRLHDRLPGVYWLNYFGPSFVAVAPGLLEVDGAEVLGNGGVLIQASEDPWVEVSSDSPVVGQIVRLLPVEGISADIVGLPFPSIADHVAASPGTMVMPWEVAEQRKVEAKSAKVFARELAKVSALVAERAEPELAADAEEWSAALDSEQWKNLTAFLRRKFGGELKEPLGRAFFAAALNAPVEEELHVLFRTDLGVVRVGWFVDDEDAIDAYVYGSADVVALCDAWCAKNIGA